MPFLSIIFVLRLYVVLIFRMQLWPYLSWARTCYTGSKSVRRKGFELYKKFAPALPICDFITDCWTIYNWHFLCPDLNCNIWKLGLWFVCWPSLIGSIYSLTIVRYCGTNSTVQTTFLFRKPVQFFAKAKWIYYRVPRHSSKKFKKSIRIISIWSFFCRMLDINCLYG